MQSCKCWLTACMQHDAGLSPARVRRQAQKLRALRAGSQVCNLSWSKNVNEIVSTHGYSQNQIIVWRCPAMTKLATLTGHTMRVLYLASSPDGQTVVTGAGGLALATARSLRRASLSQQQERAPRCAQATRRSGSGTSSPAPSGRPPRRSRTWGPSRAPTYGSALAARPGVKTTDELALAVLCVCAGQRRPAMACRRCPAGGSLALLACQVNIQPA